MKKQFLLLALALMVPVSAASAIAHEDGDSYDAWHDRLRSEHEQIHQLFGQGFLSPAQHAWQDSRLASTHDGCHLANGMYHNRPRCHGQYSNYGSYYGGNDWWGPRYAHRVEHEALLSQHREVHRLLDAGLISPQEHAALDARIEQEHAYNDYNNGWNEPYNMPMNAWYRGY